MRILMLPALLLAVADCSCLVAQTPEQSPITLHSQARLVAVDVVVTDRDHHPVHDLKLADFAVLEGGKPQTVNSFQEHRAPTGAEAAKIPPVPPMPPGYFTNYTATPANVPVNILLLDALNTPMEDQAYVRQQLLAYLKNARAGGNVAIFGLSSRLVMLQGFTSDPEILRMAVTKLNNKASLKLDDVIGGNGTADTADDKNQTMDGIMSDFAVANLQTLLDMQASVQTMQRAKDTLDAMNVLARYLAAIPGRKNLIWFSGSFPLEILPDVQNGANNSFVGVDSVADEYQETSRLLTQAQVAVYPIDARGLMVAPTMSGATDGRKYAHNPNAFKNDLTNFSTSTAQEHATMQRLGDDTGGRAFLDTNGLTDAVEKATADGSNYYTLTYRPPEAKSKGEFRKIQVQLAGKGYTLEYRHGYYADGPANTNVEQVPWTAGTWNDASGENHDPTLILKAMYHGVPGATQIMYKVRVLPTLDTAEDKVAPQNIANEPNQATSKPPYRRYSVDYGVVPNDISYTATPDGVHHVVVEFVTVVYQPDGLVVNRISTIVRASLDADQFKHVQQHGFPYHQEISVPVKGDYSIRTAVHDIRTNRIGATELPVALVRKLSPIHATATPATHP